MSMLVNDKKATNKSHIERSTVQDHTIQSMSERSNYSTTITVIMPD